MVNPQSPPKRDGRQFSLRYLLVALTLFCFLLGAIAWKYHREMVRRYWLSKVGDSLQRLEQSPPPKGVTPVQWRDCVEWTCYSLHGNSLIYHAEANDIEALAEQLESHTKGGIDIETIHSFWDAYARFAPIGKRYQHYRAIMLRDADLGLTDADMGSLRPSTSRVFLAGRWSSRAAATDAALEHFERLNQVEWLCMDGTKITDEGLSNLHAIRNLRWLSLNYTRISDDGLSHLKQLQSLECLYLYGTDISDDGVECLSELGNLEELSVSGTKVTDQGKAELEKLLPNAEIW